MEDVFNQCREASTVNEEYISEVALSLQFEDGSSPEYNAKIKVKFGIEFEHRSWGLKDVYPYFDDPLKILYTVDGKEKELEINLSDIHIDWAEGGGYYPTDLYVFIKTDGTVDFEKSYLDFAYYKP